MGEEASKPASAPTGAVFLSYASQDAEAAERICDGLRAAGIEVWFDRSELRGGDAWDRSIRKQIRCALFVPIISKQHDVLSHGFYFFRRYREAAAAATEAINLDPGYTEAYGDRGFAEYGSGDFERARSSCAATPDFWFNQWCLAVVYDKLGRHAEADAELAKLQAAYGDAEAYPYATIYAQWGNTPKALEWLEIAMRLRDSGLVYLKRIRSWIPCARSCALKQ